MRRWTSWRTAGALTVVLTTILLASGVPGVPALPQVPAALAEPDQQPPLAFSAGTVVALRGTPHIWVAGSDGMLHWAGDTRALSQQAVNWGSRHEVSLDELQRTARGDPILGAGLVKIGDPIYLAKWETNQTAPTLLHIQSIKDVELFGINGANYGHFVVDRATWEQRFGFRTDALPHAALAPAVVPAAATATPAPPAPVNLAAREFKRHKNSDAEYEVGVEISGGRPGTRLKVSAQYEEWICTPEEGCTGTRRGEWGIYHYGPADANGRLLWTSPRHGPYKDYTYTFYGSDPSGPTTSVHFTDDLPLG
ncbi:MAG TPA: hypothetical protein VHS99_07270 [Chloroflexota bacterium]|nr:hypothetical protein [Chloroflexota bacterium]